MTLKDKPQAIAQTADRLQAFKASLDRRIRDYPTPIAGCDEQFNYLLEQRDQAAGHLRSLEASRQRSSQRPQVIRRIRDFLESSVYGTTPKDRVETPGR